jgi:protein-disulfide isomerase
VNNDSSGGSLIIAALMLGVSILGASYFLSQSIQRSGESLGQLAAAIGELEVAGAGAAPAAEARKPRMPDPEKRYEVALGDAPVRGAADAAVTIVEWSDFQCPYCARVAPTVEQIRKVYGDQVSIAFKHLPLPFHEKAQDAHQASEAARLQGKFWEMHDKIFAEQRAMSPEKYVEYAGEIGLDLDRFKKDVDSEQVKQRIKDDMAQASTLGVTGTPGFFINGRFLAGAQPFANFKRVIDEELEKDS